MINFPMSTVSLSLFNEGQIPQISNGSNADELQKLKDMVEEQKQKGHKYPLLAGVFLLFYKAGKSILTKTELYDLMEKLTIEDKNTIISAPNERYSIITPGNYKAKIKDIIKKKKWFTRRMNNSGEIEYSLNQGSVSIVLPKIESYLKIIEKRDSIFQNNSRGIMDDNLKVEIPKQSEEIINMPMPMPLPRNTKKNQNKIENNNYMNDINNLNYMNGINNLNNLHGLNSINAMSGIPGLHNLNNLPNMNFNFNLDNNNTNPISSSIISNNSKSKKKKKNNNKNSLNKSGNQVKNGKSASNIIDLREHDEDFDIIIDDGKERNIHNILNKKENIMAKNNIINNYLNQNILANNKNMVQNPRTQNKKQVKKVNKKKKFKKVKKIGENNIQKINTNTNQINQNDFSNVIDLTSRRRDLYNNINTSLNTNSITNLSINKIKNKTSNKKIKKNINKSLNNRVTNNTINTSLNNSKNNLPVNIPKNMANISPINKKVKAKKFLNNKRKLSKLKTTPLKNKSLTENNNQKNNNNNIIHVSSLLNNSINNLKNLSNGTQNTTTKEKTEFSVKKDKPTDKPKKPYKKKDYKSLGFKMNSIISIGELFLNLLHKKELNQLTNKKLLYFKEKIEKKEQEIAEDKQSIENLIQSHKKMRTVNDKELSDLVDVLKTLYKTFRDKIEMLQGYKVALDKSESNDKSSIAEGIENYKQVLAECNEILTKMVEIINLTVKDYDCIDDFVTTICLEEKDINIRQNIGVNIYDFRKKIKCARYLDDVADLFKQELENAKIDDMNLFDNNLNNLNNKNRNNKKQKNVNIVIELNQTNSEDIDMNFNNNTKLGKIIGHNDITIKIPDFHNDNNNLNLNGDIKYLEDNYLAFKNNTENIIKKFDDINIEENKNNIVNKEYNKEKNEIIEEKIEEGKNTNLQIIINKEDQINEQINKNGDVLKILENKKTEKDIDNNKNEGNNLEEANKENKTDKIESLDTNAQSNDSANSAHPEGV